MGFAQALHVCFSHLSIYIELPDASFYACLFGAIKQFAQLECTKSPSYNPYVVVADKKENKNIAW